MTTEATILIVEDNQAILEGISRGLAQAGYEVAKASNGEEGLARLNEGTPDLILCDIMMPVMDGYDFYRALRANPEWELVPFVFITAKGRPEEIRAGMRLGVDDYLPKPFEIDDVLDVVTARLRRARGIQQATHREMETLKDRILILLNHELRTPVTFIKGYSNLAMLDAENTDPETLVQFLSGIELGSERLVHLIDNLLRAVEIEGGQAARAYEKRKTRLDWSPFIEDVTAPYRAQATQQQIALDVQMAPDLPPIEAHWDYLKEALGHVLDNAFKFSSSGGRVAVQAGAQDGEITVAVSDQGRGIPLEEQPFVFDAFHQVDRERYEQQGAGLGLAIARGLVELHGGQIDVESEEGSGSTFTIVLPNPNHQ